jgi:hypothetical protein
MNIPIFEWNGNSVKGCLSLFGMAGRFGLRNSLTFNRASVSSSSGTGLPMGDKPHFNSVRGAMRGLGSVDFSRCASIGDHRPPPQLRPGRNEKRVRPSGHFVRSRILRYLCVRGRVLFAVVARCFYVVVGSLNMGRLGGQELTDGERQFLAKRVTICRFGFVFCLFGGN